MCNETPKDSLFGKPLVVKPMNKEWERNICDQWWYHKNSDPPQTSQPFDSNIFLLRKKLLDLGGHEVVLPVIESDLYDILNNGKLWYGDKVKLFKGLPNNCHYNSIQYWHRQKNNVKMCTGYALSEDGGWRQHSWVIRNDGTIIETTVPRVAYFGFILSNEQANQFYETQY